MICWLCIEPVFSILWVSTFKPAPKLNKYFKCHFSIIARSRAGLANLARQQVLTVTSASSLVCSSETSLISSQALSSQSMLSHPTPGSHNSPQIRAPPGTAASQQFHDISRSLSIQSKFLIAVLYMFHIFYCLEKKGCNVNSMWHGKCKTKERRKYITTLVSFRRFPDTDNSVRTAAKSRTNVPRATEMVKRAVLFFLIQR